MEHTSSVQHTTPGVSSNERQKRCPMRKTADTQPYTRTQDTNTHTCRDNIATKGNVRREKTNGTKNTTTKRNRTQNQSVVVMDVVKRGHKIISRRFKMNNHHCENTQHTRTTIHYTNNKEKIYPVIKFRLNILLYSVVYNYPSRF